MSEETKVTNGKLGRAIYSLSLPANAALKATGGLRNEVPVDTVDAAHKMLDEALALGAQMGLAVTFTVATANKPRKSRKSSK